MSASFNARAAIKGRKLNFDPADRLRGFETPAIVKKRARRLIMVLDRQENLPSLYLANALSECGHRVDGKRHYCGLACCPVCMRSFRRWFTNEVAEIAQSHTRKSGKSGVFVTIIPSGMRAPIGGLQKIDIAALNRRMKRAFARLALGRPIIGGIDVSFNEQAGSKGSGHYQVHVAFYVAGHPASKKACERLKDYISSRLRLEPRAFVRVQVKAFKNPVRQGSYLYKSRFEKRLSYVREDGRRGTRKFGLKPPQLAEIALWLRRWPDINRVLRHGVQLRQGHLVGQSHSKRGKRGTTP